MGPDLTSIPAPEAAGWLSQYWPAILAFVSLIITGISGLWTAFVTTKQRKFELDKEQELQQIRAKTDREIEEIRLRSDKERESINLSLQTKLGEMETEREHSRMQLERQKDFQDDLLSRNATQADYIDKLLDRLNTALGAVVERDATIAQQAREIHELKDRVDRMVKKIAEQDAEIDRLKSHVLALENKRGDA